MEKNDEIEELSIISKVIGISLKSTDDLEFLKSLQGEEREAMLARMAASLNYLQLVGGNIPKDRIKQVPNMNLEEAKKLQNDISDKNLHTLVRRDRRYNEKDIEKAIRRYEDTFANR